MKKITLFSVTAMVALSSSIAMADSKVKESVVVNTSNNTGNATLAIGEDNLASTGSINIKDSEVEKSVLVNTSNNTGNATLAIGEGNTATTGSIAIE